MRFVRFSSLAGLAALASACSGPAVPDHVAASSAAIVDGLPSTSEEDFVVHLYVTGQGSCTGTLVAPNTVLTALHCISEFDLLKTFACNNDGSVSPIQEGGGILGPQLAPERVEIRIGPRPLDDPPSAFGSRIFGTGSNTVCHDDLALIVLDRNLEPPPQRLRFQERIIRGDSELIVGYGQTDSESSG
ncbi:MAG TPA: trypsin-like serine protease, partial [Polyangiaceae bacterium]